jgi:hypothetical protein
LNLRQHADSLGDQPFRAGPHETQQHPVVHEGSPAIALWARSGRVALRPEGRSPEAALKPLREWEATCRLDNAAGVRGPIGN